MLKHDELYHYGIRGMKWGVKKAPQTRADKLDKKAEKYEKLANKKSDRQATGEANLARAYTLGMNLALNPQARAVIKVGSTAKRAELAADYAVTALRIKNQKKELLYKAAKLRRKAEKIRNKKFKDIDAKHEKLTFDSVVNKAKAKLKDPLTQQTALRVTRSSVILAQTLYKYRKPIGIAVKVGTAAYKRHLQNKPGYGSTLKKLAEVSQSTKFDGAMKDGYSYYVNWDGSLSKAGKVKIK